MKLAGIDSMNYHLADSVADVKGIGMVGELYVVRRMAFNFSSQERHFLSHLFFKAEV